MDNLSIFAERLKEYMTETELSVSDLAKTVKCSRATVSALVNGAHLPSLEVLVSLVELFNCSADYLLGLTEYPKTFNFGSVKPFAERLKTCMKENGVSEYKLRTEQNISGSLTYRWLAGKAQPTVASLVKLRNYFGCTVDYLLGREN